MSIDIIPKIKKKVSSFMNDEKGNVSKQSMLSIGTLLSTIAAAGIVLKEAEAGAISISASDDGVNAVVTGSHSHHSSHSSHGSHSSHSSHASHGSHSSHSSHASHGSHSSHSSHASHGSHSSHSSHSSGI